MSSTRDSRIIEILAEYGGTENSFKQRDYITHCLWGQVDPTLRQGAWVGNTVDGNNKITSYGLSAGVCAGLVCAYLISGRQWDYFTMYVHSEKGKGLIRGISNMMRQRSENNTFWKSAPRKIFRKARPFFKRNIHAITYTEIADINLKINGIIFIHNKNILMDDLADKIQHQIINNLSSGKGYYIDIQGPTNGHALGMRIEQGAIKFFDPNFGEFTFPYQQGNSEGMVLLITRLIALFYGDYTSLTACLYSIR